MDPEDYPSRDTALAIVAALDRMEDGTWSELERLSGVTNVITVITVITVTDRCYHVYGYSELEPATMAGRMSEAFMRPRKAARQNAPNDTPEPPPASPHDGYGFTPRR